MMRFLLSIFLLLISPLSVFAVFCEMHPSEDGYWINCYDVPTGGGSDTNANVMTKQDCQELQSETVDALTSGREMLEGIKDDISDVEEHLSEVEAHNNQIKTLAIRSQDYNVQTQILEQAGWVTYETQEAGLRLYDLYNQVVGVQGEMDNAISSVQSYRCSSIEDCQSSGDGSATCPCTEEFNSALTVLSEMKNKLIEISPAVLSNQLLLVRIDANLQLISDSFSSITNRLNAPDDRMWEELDAIYGSLYSNMVSVSSSQIGLGDLLHDFKHLVRGDGNTPFYISTEGIVSLYSSLFGMARTVQEVNAQSNFVSAVTYFSNTVSRLFQDYKTLTTRGNGYVPDDSRYVAFYSVFTNDAYDARTRYRRLTLSQQGASTNWFQRMELYQQAALGWFERYSYSEWERSQAQKTESSLEHSLEQTTNDFSNVTKFSGALTNSVNALVRSMVDDFSAVQIQASLPTQITIFPEFSMGALGSFGPIVWRVSELAVCDTIRSVTSLVWKISIWALYLLVAFGVARLVFILVLYLVNLAKDL